MIEDSAHGLFGKYKGQCLGSFGALATQSFHETKNITCGEGGALLINDEKYLERAEILREKGTNRSQFFRGEVDKYTWVDLGSSYLPSDILAAFLFAQFESAETIQNKRKKMWEFYAEALTDWAEQEGIGLPRVPPHCEQSYHMFYLLCPTLRDRTLLIKGLQKRGIQSVFHFLPLHLSKMGENWHYKHGDCPVTEDMSDRLLRLPFYNDLSLDDQQRVCETIFEVYKEF
ncbi:MAG: DegT/DnrJ/EryC1/StrS family aminotransferase [Candidatus Aminicenantaceae bacterium]